ncbi:hypothetical protein ACOMHN_028081 [Nucella lapillus]
MHPVLHAMTQHDRATTCDVREETKSRDYTEVANRRESPTTVRAGSTARKSCHVKREDLKRQSRVTSRGKPTDQVTRRQPTAEGGSLLWHVKTGFPCHTPRGRSRTVTMHYGVNALHVPADRL